MSSNVNYPEDMRREALKLIAATEANPDEESAMAIYEFIERSPEHEACYILQVKYVIFYRNHLSPLRTPQDIRPFRVTRDVAPSRRLRGVGLALLGLALILVVAVSWRLIPGERAGSHIELFAEQPTFYDLPDGSHLVLNGGTRLTIDLSSHNRRIEILSGGLAARPTHDDSQPFDVVSGNTTIRSLGTQFSVLRRPQETEVSVREGKVRVSASNGGSAELAPGEATNVNALGSISTPRRSAAGPSLRPTTLNGNTISEVAAAFNATNSTTQLEVKGDRGRRYDFHVQLDNPEEWLSELESMDVGRIARREDLITIVTITVN